MNSEFDSEILKKIEGDGIDNEFLEHLLGSLFNTFPDHIYLKDRESRFILINQSLREVFKLKSPEEAVGKTDFAFFTEEHAGAAFKDEQEIMKTGKGKTNFVEKETWEDGSVTWAASTKVPFYDKNGKIIGLFGISRDITARRTAEIEMNNRARELDCFIEISRIAKKKELSADGHIRKIATLLPEFLEHAHIVSARIIIGHKAFKSRAFKETPHMRKFRISDDEKTKIGEMEVFTSREVKKFGKTTEQVIKLIADRVNEVIQKKWIEKDLRKWEHILKDAENHMDLYP